MPAKAHAQHWEGAVSVGSIGGYTDNVAPNLVGPSVADYFLQLRPQVLFRYETPRSLTQLAYDFNAFLYANETDANSISHNARLSTRTQITQRTQLRLALGASTGQLNTLQLAQTPESATAEIVADSSEFVAVDVDQRLRVELNRHTKLLQRYRISIFDRVAETSGLPVSRGATIDTSLGISREWPRDALDVSTSVALNDLTNNRGTADASGLIQFDLSVGGRWQRTLSPRWTSTINGGLTVSRIPGQTVRNNLRPSGAAELAYFDQWGGLVLAYQHSIQPNLSIARNTNSDGASLRAWLPVPYLRGDGPVPRVAFSSTVGATYGRIVDLVNDTTPADWNSEFFDAGLVWLINGSDLVLSVRYQHTRQRADSDVVVSYNRNVFTVSLSGALSKGRARPPTLRSEAGEDREARRLRRLVD